MREPRIVMLIHGGPHSIEAARAQGIAQSYPASQIHFLFRGPSRAETAKEWSRKIGELRPDLLYVLNTALPGALLALRWKARGIPFILDTGDVIYEMARCAGTEPRWKLPLLKTAESLAQRQARAVVVRGTRHLEHLRKLGLPRVHLLRDGYMPHPPTDETRLAGLREKHGLNGFFVPGVMGSLVRSPRLNICYGWDLIEALGKLRDLPAKALVIGDGPGQGWLQEKAARLGVAERVVFCGRIPYSDVPAYLRLMDAALSTQTNNLPGQVRTTGKLPEYMAAERFILASRVGEAAILLPEIMLLDFEGEADAAYPARLAARIRQLQGNPSLLEARRALPALAEKHCSYPVLSEQFRTIVSAALR